MQDTSTANHERIFGAPHLSAAHTLAEAVEQVLSDGVLLRDAVGAFERRAEDTPPDRRASMIAERPRDIDAIADAFVCATAEHLAGMWLLDPPRWCLDPWTRRLPEAFYLHGHSDAARWLAQRTSPFAYRRRNLLVPADLLHRTPEPRWTHSLSEWWLMPVDDIGLPVTVFVRVARQVLSTGWAALIVLGHKRTLRFAEGPPVIEVGAEGACQLSGPHIRDDLMRSLREWGIANFDLLRDLTEGRVDPLAPPRSFARPIGLEEADLPGSCRAGWCRPATAPSVLRGRREQSCVSHEYPPR